MDCLRRVDCRPVVVLEDVLHPRLRGGLRWGGRRWLIILNQRDSRRRARFTLGHELAHILLVVHPAPAESHRESFCDAFAAELLMPEAALRRAWQRRRSAHDLARAFEVTVPAMRRRLAQLALVLSAPATAPRPFPLLRPAD